MWYPESDIGLNFGALAVHQAVLAAREALASEPAAGAGLKLDVAKSLTTIAWLLQETGKADEAKEVQARNNKIPYLTVKKFAGRKGKSDRVVLVEMFTSAQAPPTVAATLACDALEQTYKPSEVIVISLQEGELHPGFCATTRVIASAPGELIATVTESGVPRRPVSELGETLITPWH